MMAICGCVSFGGEVLAPAFSWFTTVLCERSLLNATK